MPLLLLVVGAVILLTAFKGTSGQLATDLGQDLPGFTHWLLALVIIMLFSYIPGFRPVANAFFALVIVAILLAHSGFFNQLQAALNQVGTGLNTGTVNPVPVKTS